MPKQAVRNNRVPQKNTSATARRKRKRRGRYTLYYIFFIVITFVAAAILYFSMFYKITSLEVVGESRYSSERILGLTGLSVGQSFFEVDKEEIRQNILAQLPYLGEVTVKQKFPTGVVIEVKEATIVGAFDTGTNYVLVSDANKIVETGLWEVEEGITVIKGIQIDSPTVGATVTSSETEKLELLQILLQNIQATGFNKITYIDMSDLLNMKVMYDDRILVELGTQSELENKLKFAKKMLEEQIGQDVKGVLNATNHKRISLRESAQ